MGTALMMSCVVNTAGPKELSCVGVHTGQPAEWGSLNLPSSRDRPRARQGQGPEFLRCGGGFREEDCLHKSAGKHW